MLKRLHIVGCPRSGTTLLMEIMSTCFQSDGVCEHEISIFEDIPVSDGIYISKKPSDIKNLQHIYPHDPNLYIIYMVRDPRSVITSKHHSNREQYFCNFKAWKACDSAAQQYLPGGRFDQLQRFLQIRYEDLVADPDSAQQAITDRFGFLQQLHRFSDFEKFAKPSDSASKAMNGLRPISQQRIEGWKNHLPRIKQQLQLRPELAQDLLRLRYEQDNSWQQQLASVEATAFPCRYPERTEFFKELEKSLRMRLRSRRYLARLSAS